jgi:hypothetical protein
MILILEIKIISTFHSQGCQSIEMVFTIWALNHLPSYIKELSDDRIQFKNVFKKYLLLNSFYSLKDFLMVKFSVKDGIGAFNRINMYYLY